MRVRTCAICGEVKTIAEFGNGITCPKTTCLSCKAKTARFVELATIMFIRRTVRGEV